MNGENEKPKQTYEELESQVSMLIEDLHNLTEQKEERERKDATKITQLEEELKKRPTKEELTKLADEVKDLTGKLEEAKNTRRPIYTYSTETPFNRLTAILEESFTKEELQEGLGDLYEKFHQPNQF